MTIFAQHRLEHRKKMMFLIFFLLVGLTSVYSNESSALKDNIYFNAGYMTTAEDNLNNSFSFSAGGNIFISKRLSMGLDCSASFLASEVALDPTKNSNSLSRGDLTILGFYLIGSYHIPFTSSRDSSYSPRTSGENLSIYLSAGAGYSLNSFRVTSDFSSLGFDVEENVDNSFVFCFAAGADMAISDSLGLNLDVRYTVSNARRNYKVTDRVSGTSISGETDIDLGRLSITAGLKFFL